MKSNFLEKYSIPKLADDNPSWNLSRKHFIKTAIAGGVLTQLPLIRLSAQNDNLQNVILNEAQLEIIESVQDILFPSDNYGPGAKEINAANYLLWVLSDPGKDPGEVSYIIDGISWVNETSEEKYSERFVDLNPAQKENIIALISFESWGESWLSVLLSFIFEALFCDPQYGGNPDGIGWNWLEHNPGQPRPTIKLLYPEILYSILKS